LFILRIEDENKVINLLSCANSTQNGTTMKANEIKVGDTLYSVDPQKLVITRSDVIEVSNGYCNVMREHYTFKQRVKALVRIALDKFPTEYNGILYFRTEDDAHTFVKLQIGL